QQPLRQWRRLRVHAPGRPLATTGLPESLQQRRLRPLRLQPHALGRRPHPGRGRAHRKQRGGALWQQQAYLKAAVTAADDQFGTSLSLSADGQLLAVGAPLEDGAALGLNGDATDKRQSNSGAAYLFE